MGRWIQGHPSACGCPRPPAGPSGQPGLTLAGEGVCLQGPSRPASSPRPGHGRCRREWNTWPAFLSTKEQQVFLPAALWSLLSLCCFLLLCSLSCICYEGDGSVQDKDASACQALCSSLWLPAAAKALDEGAAFQQILCLKGDPLLCCDLVSISRAFLVRAYFVVGKPDGVI